MDENKKKHYAFTPTSTCTLVIGMKLDFLPEPFPSTIIKRTENDIHRNLYNMARIITTKLKGGDSQLKIIRKNRKANLLDVLKFIDRVVFEVPLPIILYVIRYEFDNFVREVEKQCNVICKIVVEKEPILLIAGKLSDGLKAKAKIILWIEKISGRICYSYEGYVSSEILLKMNVRIYYLSKINSNRVILVQDRNIKDALDEMEKKIIDVIIEMDKIKYTYLVFYERQRIERMLGENDCYMIETCSECENTSEIIIRGFKKLNIKRCCLEMQNLLQDVIKIAFVEDEIRVEAHEVFIFEIERDKRMKNGVFNSEEILIEDEIDNICMPSFSRSLEDKEKLAQMKYTNMRNTGIGTKVRPKYDFSQPLKRENCVENETMNQYQYSNFKIDNESLFYSSNLKIDKDLENRYSKVENDPIYQYSDYKNMNGYHINCNKHKSRMYCDCSSENNKPAQFIRENYRFIGIGLKKEVKNMLSRSNLVYEVIIDIEPDLEDFLCGKKNGKINKICRDNESEVTISSKIEYNERKIEIFIAGIGQNIRSAIMALDNEFPAELSFYLDEKHHRRIIGYGGRNIQKFMKKHGVYIKFMGNEEWLNQTFPGNVVIKTPRRNIDSLVRMKKDIMSLAEEPCENIIPQRQFVSLFTYYELFWGDAKLCFDHAILNETETPKIYLVNQGDIENTTEGRPSKLITLNKVRFLFTLETLNLEIISLNKWVEKKSNQTRIFDSVLMCSYEPVLKTKDGVDFGLKICKPDEMIEDEYIVGKRKRDEDRQAN